jgi:hypothetical protein
MFCPICGQQQISEETRYCSRCGFLLAGVTRLIANGGALPEFSSPPSGGAKKDSPRKRGLKQGLFIFLLTFLVVPLVAILSIALEVKEPFAVAICAILLSVGGLLRMIYALLFESSEPFAAAGGGKTLEQNVMDAAQNILGKNPAAAALPPQQSIPTSTYVPPAGGAAGSWRDTNDLTAPAQQPGSVTEKTTRFLDRK